MNSYSMSGSIIMDTCYIITHRINMFINTVNVKSINYDVT